MNHSLKPLYITLLLSAFLLSACTHSQSSVDSNARHAASQLAKLHFDPNTRPLIADSIRVTAKFLNQFYVMGKQDRASGLSMEQAQQRVLSFTRCEVQSKAETLPSEHAVGPFDPSAQKSQFLTQVYAAEQPEKQARILLESAIKTYWDGYNGHP